MTDIERLRAGVAKIRDYLNECRPGDASFVAEALLAGSPLDPSRSPQETSHVAQEAEIERLTAEAGEHDRVSRTQTDEIAHLNAHINKQDAEIERLQTLLVDAGITFR